MRCTASRSRAPPTATPEVFGYHPILATRADTGEVLHARLRKGSSQRGHKRFVEELIARVRRAGATGELTVRADSGFWSYALIDTLTASACAGRSRSRSTSRSGRASTPSTRPPGPRSPTPTAAKPKLRETIYSPAAAASIADRAARRAPHPAHRPRPSRGCGPTGDTTRSSPTSTCPSSRWTSSTATTPPSSSPSATSKKAPGWSTARPASSSPTPPGSRCAVLAHNLTRWTARLGGIHPDDQLTVTRTIRTRLLALPGRLVNRSGRHVLRLPERWPWQRRSPPRSTSSAPCRCSAEPQPADRRGRTRPPRADNTTQARPPLRRAHPPADTLTTNPERPRPNDPSQDHPQSVDRGLIIRFRVRVPGGVHKPLTCADAVAVAQRPHAQRSFASFRNRSARSRRRAPEEQQTQPLPCCTPRTGGLVHVPPDLRQAACARASGIRSGS